MRNVEHKKKLISTGVLITYIIMIGINGLAYLLPLNNIRTEEVFNKYENLFVPLKFTFYIWLVIYILVGMYTIYQFKFNTRRPDNNDRVVRKVNIYFILSNIANILWNFSWHYEQIMLSTILMCVLLYLLISIRIVITHRSSLSKSEKLSIQFPFSVYLGWVSVMATNNIVTLLVFLKWDRMGYSELFITEIVLVLFLIVVVLTTLKFKDIVFGIVIIWGYVGILIKHYSLTYFNQAYPEIINIIIGSIIVLIIADLFVLLSFKLKKKRRP